MSVGAPGRDRPTLESVAMRAGVSRATASRVVNGSTTVAPRIRDAVLRAVADLGYVPNQAARSLVTQRTDSMALVLSEAASRVFSDDPYFAGIIRGVSHELEAADRQLVLMMAAAGPGIDRLTGYRTELRDSDRRSIVAVGDFTRESGSAAMRQLLADDPHLDAVFVASDLMADGALRALRQSGRRVPDDVAVVGFDDAD